MAMLTLAPMPSGAASLAAPTPSEAPDFTPVPLPMPEPIPLVPPMTSSASLSHPAGAGAGAGCASGEANASCISVLPSLELPVPTDEPQVNAQLLAEVKASMGGEPPELLLSARSESGYKGVHRPSGQPGLWQAQARAPTDSRAAASGGRPLTCPRRIGRGAR